MDNAPQEIHVVSVMTHSPLERRATVRDEKGDRLLPPSMLRQNILTVRNTNPHSDQAINREFRKTRMKFHADSNSVKIRNVDSVILPCIWITNLKKVVSMATNAISDLLRLKDRPTRSRRKVVRKDQVRYWRSLRSWVVCLKIVTCESLFHMNLENWDQIAPSNAPKAHGTKSKFGKKRVHREDPKKCASWA